MTRVTAEAARQVEDLIDFYLVQNERPEAARRLLADLAQAWQRIEAAPSGGTRYPRPYPTLAGLGFRWIKARIYWVSWALTTDGPVITNVLHDSADLEARATPSIDDVRER